MTTGFHSLPVTESLIRDHVSDLEDHLRLKFRFGKVFNIVPLSEDDVRQTCTVIGERLFSIYLLSSVQRKIIK